MRARGHMSPGERSDFNDLPLRIVSRPLACLLAVLKISRPHLAAVFSKPLPVTLELAILHMALSLDASVLVPVDAFFHVFSQWNKSSLSEFKGPNPGGFDGDALREVRKADATGYHHLRTHRSSMYQLR